MPQLDPTILSEIFNSTVIIFFILYVVVVYKGLSFLVLRQLIINHLSNIVHRHRHYRKKAGVC